MVMTTAINFEQEPEDDTQRKERLGTFKKVEIRNNVRSIKYAD